MPTSLSRNEAIARCYYRRWGCLPLDMAAMLVEDGYIIEELEREWDEELEREWDEEFRGGERMSDIRPIGIHSGDNKFGLHRCPMCGQGPSADFCTAGNFMFRDGRSSIEYRISALCQDCQDDVFGHFDIEKGGA